MENMVNSAIDSNLKVISILSTLMQHLLISIVDNAEQLLSTQVTFPNQGVKMVRIACVQFLKDGKVASTKIYFSTNIEM
jgi:hypothetical protein